MFVGSIGLLLIVAFAVLLLVVLVIVGVSSFSRKK